MKRSQDYDLWFEFRRLAKLMFKYVGNYLRDHERISTFDFGRENTIYSYSANISCILRKKYGKKNDPLNNFSSKKQYFQKICRRLS